MANATSTELQELYIAYFGRAADPTGLDYWTESGTTAASFAASMHAQAEFDDVYGSLSVESQVNQIYKNLFNRAADVTGLTYWTQQINLGNLQLAEIAVHLIWAAKNNTGGEDDKTALSNRTDAAVAYTAKVKETTSGILAYAAASTSPWVEGDNIAEAKSYMSGIDKDTASTSAGIATSVSTIVTNGAQSGKKTFTLTTGTNKFTGGDASDTFDASTKDTLTNGDVLKGGDGGADKLTAKFTVTNTTTVNTTAIEYVDLTATAQTTLNMAAATGITKLTSSASTAALTLNNLQSLADVYINTVATATTLNYANTAMSGTADDLLINLDGSSSSGSDIALTAASGATNKIETVSIKSGSVANTVNDLQTTSVGSTKLEVTGDQNLTITTALDSEIVTVDASSFTGGLSVAGASNIVKMTGGSGNDTFNFAATLLTNEDTIAGGTGTDTISYSGDEAVALTDFTNVTSVETLTSANAVQITGNLGAKAKAAGITTVTFNDDGDGDNLVIDAEFDSTALTANLDDGDNTFDASAYTGTLTAKITEEIADANADTNTITASSTVLTDVLSITADGTGIDNDKMTTFTGFDKLVIANDASTGTIILDQVNIADNQTFTVDLSALVGTTNGTTHAATVDAKDDTNGKLVVIGGSGGDTITGSLSDHGDSISGGAGNDTIKFSTDGLTSDDTIAGGDGTDTLEYVVTNEAILEADFTNVTSMEVLTTANSIQMTGNLGAKAKAAGITTITLNDDGDGDNIVIDAEFDSTALTANLDDGDNTFDASSYTGTLTAKITEAIADTNADTNTISASTTVLTDVLSITADGTGIDNDKTNSFTGFDKLVIANNAATGTINIDELTVGDNVLFTVDASAITSDLAFTISLADDSNGKFVVTGGSGSDSITGSASDHADNLSGGAGGTDTFTFATLNLTSDDTVAGGAGNDTLTMSDAATVLDADFTNITSVEAISSGDNTLTLTTGSVSAAAGLNTITMGTGADDITIGVNSSSAITAALSTGADSVVATNYTGVLTVTADVDSITAADTITGGAGTADVLSLSGQTTDNTGLTAAELNLVTGFEKYVTSDNTAIDIAVDNTNVASGKTLTVDFSTLTTAVGDFDASAVTTAGGTVDITAGGTGAHQIVLGNGSDKYTSTSSGADAVTATAGANTISTGAGNDSITLGTGADHVTGGSGADRFTVATANLTSADTLAGGDGDDIITLSNAATVVDADFTNVTSVESISSGDNVLTLTTGTLSASAGLNTITMGTGADDITIGVNSSSAITAALSTGNDSVVATNYTGTLTVTADVDSITADDTITGGTGTADVLSLSGAQAALTAAEMAGITKFEVVKVTDDTATEIVFADTFGAASQELTFDVTAMTSAKFTMNGGSETDATFNLTTSGSGAHVITLGSGSDSYTSAGTGATTVTATAGANTISTSQGADSITAGSGVDNISSGQGADIISFATANLNLSDTVDAGAGTDTLKMTNASTIIDSDFDNISNIETLVQGTASHNMTATLGVHASTAGIATITGGTGTNVLTLGSGMTTNLAVNLGAGTDTITATNYTKTLTVTADIDSLESGDTLTGGAGTDILTITLDTITDQALAASDLANITKFDTWKTGSNVAATIVTHDANVASGESLTVNLEANTSTAASFSGAAETNGSFVITATSSTTDAAHVITLGAGADSYTSTSAGIDTVTATGGANTISVGAGADIIISGSGVDSVTLGAGADVFRTSTSNLRLGVDIITDFAQDSDQIEMSLAAIEQMAGDLGGNLVFAGNASDDTASGDIEALADVTGAYDLATGATATILNVSGTFADTDAIEDALESAGTRALTANKAFAVDDMFLLTYSDGTNSFFAVAELNAVVADDAQFASGALSIQNLVQLNGITGSTTDAAAFDAGDFDLVA